MREQVSRSAIITEALSWVGTPYQHQMSIKGAGCDCLGLVRGIWREFYGDEPMALPPYTPDWAEKSKIETLKNAADECLQKIEISQARPADILLFRMQAGVPAKHIAIVLDEDLIVHAYWGRAVTKSFLAPFWRRRRAYAYSFPNVRD